jgi:hypothetical protein
MTVFSRALNLLADTLRPHRLQRATRWRKLSAGRQALLVVAYLRKGETYAELTCGFRIGTSTVYRYVREAVGLLAAMAPTLEQTIEVARRNRHPRRHAAADGPGRHDQRYDRGSTPL